MNNAEFDPEFENFDDSPHEYEFMYIDQVYEELEIYLKLIPNGEVKAKLTDRVENGNEVEVLNFLCYFSSLHIETQDSVLKFMTRCQDKIFWEIILKAAENIPTTVELEMWFSVE